MPDNYTIDATLTLNVTIDAYDDPDLVKALGTRAFTGLHFDSRRGFVAAFSEVGLPDIEAVIDINAYPDLDEVRVDEIHVVDEDSGAGNCYSSYDEMASDLGLDDAEDPECIDGTLNRDNGPARQEFPPFLRDQLDRRADAVREKHEG